jgi:hypothetical protein
MAAGLEVRLGLLQPGKHPPLLQLLPLLINQALAAPPISEGFLPSSCMHRRVGTSGIVVDGWHEKSKRSLRVLRVSFAGRQLPGTPDIAPGGMQQLNCRVMVMVEQ